MQPMVGIQLSLFKTPSRERFSSNDVADFAAMLSAFTGAEVSVLFRGWAHAGSKSEDALIPFGGCWTPSIGRTCLVQRRKRVFVVADFAGQRRRSII